MPRAMDPRAAGQRAEDLAKQHKAKSQRLNFLGMMLKDVPENDRLRAKAERYYVWKARSAATCLPLPIPLLLIIYPQQPRARGTSSFRRCPRCSKTTTS